MPYPNFSKIDRVLSRLRLDAQLRHELGAQNLDAAIGQLETALESAARNVEAAPIDAELAAREPDDLDGIRALRPDGPRRLWSAFDADLYADRLEGAMLGRFAGCTLGSIVENWAVDKMRKWAEFCGDNFPPTDYWTHATDPHMPRYAVAARREYTRDGINGVPPDDDIVYTLLGLLIAEEHGLDFTRDDVGAAWLRYLPIDWVYTAEKAALANLQKGIGPDRAAEVDNPYIQWIGADIRCDPWGYMAPGLPEVAADMAWRDATLSHRRNGTYGAMFFAAAIAAAFAVDDPVEAIRIGLTEIPAQCALAEAMRWALDIAPSLKDYADARAAVDEEFAGMHHVHTINNACLTVFGVAIGAGDVSRTISETVAMGLDNDCTAATAGSIAGAAAGRSGIEPHWTRNFNDSVRSYLIGQERFAISDLFARFREQARRVFEKQAPSA